MTSDAPEFEVQIAEDGRVSFAHPGQARAYLRGKFRGQTILAQFYEHGHKRTNPQNRAAHALFTEWLRHKEGWTLGSLKLYALGEVFGYLEVVHPVSGEVMLFPAEPYTSKLPVGKFCRLIEWILEAAAEQDGVVLHSPEEYTRAKAKAA